MKTTFRNQKTKALVVVTLAMLMFGSLCGSAFAAEAKATQPQDALWQYMQSSSSFWDSIMKQIGVDTSNNNCGNTSQNKPSTTPGTTTPDTTTKPDTTTPDNTTKPDTNTNQSTNSSYAQQVLQLVNKERAAQGLSSLKLDDKLSAAAQVRAAECAKSFSHTRPNGSSCFTALKEAGISYRRAAENLAYGQRTPAEVVKAWMNSSGHRANILNANYTTLGVGYTVVNGTPYWSQFFIQ